LALLATYYLLALNIEDCYVSGDGFGLDIQKMLPLCVWDLSGFKLFTVSRAECIWESVLPSVISTLSWALWVKVNWLYLFVSKF